MVPPSVTLTREEASTTALYQEACQNLRHYSTCILHMRILTVAQGILVLTGAAALLIRDQLWLSITASVFGLLFTALLFSLHRNYWLHFRAMLRTAVAFEERLTVNDLNGPWAKYNSARRARHQRWFWRISAVEGPFVLLVVSFLVLIVRDLWSLFVGG